MFKNTCYDCDHEWNTEDVLDVSLCPKCGSDSIDEEEIEGAYALIADKFGPPSVEGLWAEYISQPSASYNFSEGYGEKWEHHEARECDDCGAYVPNAARVGECPVCQATLYSDGPMMNYFYEVDIRRVGLEGAQLAIVHLPLCVVSFESADPVDYALALTGGGMDLSWEIAEAYMRLGYLPPLWLRLPHMAGHGNKWVISGVRKAAEVQSRWALNTIHRMDELEESLAEEV